MSVPPQNTNQPPPIVLTIPTQNDTNSEKEHILKLFPKRTILIFSIIQLVCAGLAGILQVGKLYFVETLLMLVMFFFLNHFSRCVLLVLTKAVITLIFQQLWVLEFGRDFSLESLVELGLSLQIGLLLLRKSYIRLFFLTKILLINLSYIPA